MDSINYLPLGSVVVLKGGIQKLLVISRGINVRLNGEVLFFDYGGVLFPEGLIDDKMAYFNHDGIEKVYFSGYDDDESRTVANNINNYVANNPMLKRGKPEM